MILESLVRLGRPFLGEGGLTHEEVIKHITDAISPNTRNFFQNVCLAEIDAGLSDAQMSRIKVHPLSTWGDFISQSQDGRSSRTQAASSKAKELFIQDPGRAVGIPFAQPSGGNPLARQGCYPVPVYIVYEKSLGHMSGNEAEVLKFLQARASFTIGWEVTEDELEVLSKGLSEVLPEPKKGPGKTMAIIVLIDYRTGLYGHSKVAEASTGGSYASLGESRLYPGETIVANLEKIVNNLWEARLQEAQEKGFLDDGTCSFCGTNGYTVSSYAKAWPLFSTTYSYPLPMELKETELVKSIGLCPMCYRALVFGANLLHKTEQTVDYTIAKELFSPAQSVQGKAYARQSSKTEKLFGLFYALPVLDGFLEDPEAAADFVGANLERLQPEEVMRKGFSLKDLLGFETVLSDEIANESYRLTVTYYMGEWSRGSVDLVATIQDVVPSVAKRVSEVCKQAGINASQVGRLIAEAWNWSFSDSDQMRYSARHSSLLYNLILAYGSSYLWQSLDSVLHRRPLAVNAFIRNVAQRLQDRVQTVGDITSHLGFRDEVVFLLSFSEFLEVYHREIVGKGEVLLMGKWQEWISALREPGPGFWEPTSVAEVGFAAGTVIRTFARQYYRKTEKDFIKHRVMTYGADLKPEDIYTKGLARLQEYALRLDINPSRSLKNAAAEVSMHYHNMADEIRKERDWFIAAFWAGYQLCPQDLYPAAVKQDNSEGEEKGDDE
jgi:hypothetical protein